MAKRRLDLTPKVRTRRDAVTGELVRTVLDAPRVAFEKAVDAVNRALLAVPTQAPSDVRDVLVAAAWVLLAELEAGRYGSDDPPGAPMQRALWREWEHLDAAGRHRFANLLRARLRRMVRHRDSDLDQDAEAA